MFFLNVRVLTYGPSGKSLKKTIVALHSTTGSIGSSRWSRVKYRCVDGTILTGGGQRTHVHVTLTMLHDRVMMSCASDVRVPNDDPRGVS